MGIFAGGGLYGKLGVSPLINAAGSDTRKGGSTLSSEILALMEEANRNWVDMTELHQKAGEHIAGLLGVEAAHVTSGAAAALTLSTAACMAGADPEQMERLPDTTGMRNEFIVHDAHRYLFDRCLTYAGGKLVRVGDEAGCTPGQLEEAIGPGTAAVEYWVGYKGDASVLSLEETVEIAHRHDVPVIADAAAIIFPLERFASTARAADLACFGGKYIGAPNASGFVCGRRDLVDAIVSHGFVEFSMGSRGFGRGMKVDRQVIVAVVAALDSWFSTNHEDRLAKIETRLSRLADALMELPGVEPQIVERFPYYFGYSLRAKIDTEALGKTARQVADDLYEENPRIWILALDDETIEVNVYTLNEGEDEIVVDRLTNALTP